MRRRSPTEGAKSRTRNPKPPPVKVMVASTIYNFENERKQIVAYLESSGYDVINSQDGRIPLNSDLSNAENCIAAVAGCDVFIGIIRPMYGSGVVGDASITHLEMREAMRLKKRRYFFVHEDVIFARTLLRQFMYDEKGVRTAFKLKKKTSVMDDIRVIDMYNEVIQDNLPVEQRIGNWAQPFRDVSDILKSIAFQLQNFKRLSGNEDGECDGDK